MSGPKCEEAHLLLSRGWPLKEKLGHLKGEFFHKEEQGNSMGISLGDKGEDPLGGNTQRKIFLGGN